MFHVIATLVKIDMLLEALEDTYFVVEVVAQVVEVEADMHFEEVEVN